MLTPLSFIYALIATHGWVLAGVLSLGGVGRVPGVRWLLLTVIAISIILLEYAASASGLFRYWTGYLLLSMPLWFTIGPTIYLFFRRIIDTSGKLPTVIPHLYLPLIIALAYLPYYLLAPEIKLGGTPGPAMAGYLQALLPCTYVLYTLQTFSYVYLTVRRLRQHSTAFKSAASSSELTYVEDVQLLVKWFCGYLAVEGLVTFSLLIVGHNSPWLSIISVIATALFIYLIAYFGLRAAIRQQAIALVEHATPPPEVARLVTNHAHLNELSNISEPEAIRLQTRLEALMETEHPYLRDDLRLFDLASRLDTSTHKLSELINRVMATSFYDLINRHRVAAAKQRLNQFRQSNQRETILAIALETGFKSQSSFYRIFKKHTGMTPVQYIHEQDREVV